MKRDDSSCREGSAIESELRTILQDTPRVLPYNKRDPDEDDELDMQHWRATTDTDAKAGATRHPLRQLHSTAKRAGNPADAKVGSIQHPSLRSSVSYRSNLNELPSCRRISCLSNDRNRDQLNGNNKSTAKTEPNADKERSKIGDLMIYPSLKCSPTIPPQR